jgi:hypothetical protein
MVHIRPAKMQDVADIQAIEKQYYEGFSCPEATIKHWIENLPENFFVAVSDNRVVAFLFFEYLHEIKAIPFVHEIEHSEDGKYVYVSEVGILDEFIESDILQTLFEAMKRKATSANCEGIVWLTGSKSKHDQIEKSILAGNSFVKKESVQNWEAYPNHHVNDHYIWYSDIQRRT